MGLIVSCVADEEDQVSPTIEEEDEEDLEEDGGGDVFDSAETCEQIVRAKFQFAGENDDEVWKLTVCLAYHSLVLLHLHFPLCCL